MIAWLIVGGCLVGFVTIWLVTAYKNLSEKRRTLNGLKEQLLMHQQASTQVRDGPDSKVADKMLETNQKIYREAVKCYNCLLKKPLNRLPAILMRFRPADESGNNNVAE